MLNANNDLNLDFTYAIIFAEAFNYTIAPMMTSSNANIFRVTGPLWHGPFVFSLICARTNGWVNTMEAGDLRGHRPHYDVTVMAELNGSSEWLWTHYWIRHYHNHIQSHSYIQRRLYSVEFIMVLNCGTQPQYTFVWNMLMWDVTVIFYSRTDFATETYFYMPTFFLHY